MATGRPSVASDQDRRPRGVSDVETEVIVIGGGQAGLAMGYHLRRRGLSFVILDAGARIGDSWRRRWEGLRLFTSARYSALPGMPFPASPRTLPTKDEVADYLEAYAQRLELPVQTGIAVDGVHWSDQEDRYLVTAGERRYRARQVVVATGAFHHPRIPGFAVDLDPGILQFHSSEFRDPSQLHDGDVLVVGASNSGAEVALIVAPRHRTILSGPDTGKMPVRPESALGGLFDVPFWWFINHVLTIETPLGRKVGPQVEAHGGPLERVWPSDLEAAGVERTYARTVGSRDGMPELDDGRVARVANVIWCTGYRQDFSWIRLPVVDADGRPRHVRGVANDAPGLYFIGLPFLYSVASPLIGGVGGDAAYLAGRIELRARTAVTRQPRPATAPGTSA
jgi:putative flavoprotein involved in K+ transport